MENKFSWFQVPDDVKQLLVLAAENWQDTSKSEQYINQALATTDDSVDVLVAAYRYFYYKHNYQMALNTANQVIDKVKVSEALPDAWEQLRPILLSRKEDEKIRLYLNAYIASGLVLAKLGKIDRAKIICVQIQEVDNMKEFTSASILMNILTRPIEDDI